VIIVNWNGKRLLRDCLKSLKAQTFRDFEIIVIDNGSTDGSERFATIRNEKNLGFSVANNQGIRRAKGKYVALLNNDARPAEDWLFELVYAADRNLAGMFASKILRPDGKIDSAGCEVYPDGNGMCRGRGKGVWEYTRSDYVGFPSGCAALYRRSMLNKIGLFDERFFMYNEDTDLGLRAQKAGWKCLYVPTAIVTHLYSQSSSAYSLKKLFRVERNRILIMLKNFTIQQIAASVPWTFARYFNFLRGTV
jgi:hypothetical protein